MPCLQTTVSLVKLEHVFQYDRMRLESALAKSSLLDVFPNETAEFVCEFLSEYGVVQNPTPASLKQILANVAKTELIAKPSVAINEIRTGMLAGSCKELWGDFRKEDVDELFDRMKLTTWTKWCLLSHNRRFPSFLSNTSEVCHPRSCSCSSDT